MQKKKTTCAISITQLVIPMYNVVQHVGSVLTFLCTLMPHLFTEILDSTFCLYRKKLELKRIYALLQ